MEIRVLVRVTVRVRVRVRVHIAIFMNRTVVLKYRTIRLQIRNPNANPTETPLQPLALIPILTENLSLKSLRRAFVRLPVERLSSRNKACSRAWRYTNS